MSIHIFIHYFYVVGQDFIVAVDEFYSNIMVNVIHITIRLQFLIFKFDKKKMTDPRSLIKLVASLLNM